MNDPASRYERLPTWERVTPDGDAQLLRQPRLPPATETDRRIRVGAGQRLDHLAGRYLGDPYAWWRIADAHPGIEIDELDTPDRWLGLPGRGRPRA